ncbi:hypothetical protein [Umezawaea sp. Da 62-37]|uniref:hypothetical protein n=1 Tax=Umezawaea sp. Da 62-37 TaxID=3075927 RepID=UPI0028F6EC3B|nr:hypothetical protein [Umezawaea sp. Da 62-37]WNV87453.1 hypothetical protein RM788_03890 [Umezawaea sp. Da 62-37]
MSWLLAALLLTATLYGLLAEHAYRLSRSLELQGIAQDVLTLATIPVLLWAARRSRAGSLPGHLLWLGTLAYLAYSYLVYAIGVPQNPAFLLYTSILALSVAALIDGIGRIDARKVCPAFDGRGHKGTGWFLIAFGSAFAALWLSDIVPTIGGGLPGTIGAGELPNPVYVADLAFALPAVVATGAALVRGHVAAPVLGAVVLVKVVTLGLAISAMAVAILLDGGDPGWPVVALVAVMIAVCTTILVRGARRLGVPASGWLRETLWER